MEMPMTRRPPNFVIPGVPGADISSGTPGQIYRLARKDLVFKRTGEELCPSPHSSQQDRVRDVIRPDWPELKVS